MEGNIVFLNGISSSGKTTIAKAFQELMGEPYFRTGLDHFLDMTHDKFHTVSTDTDPPLVDGFLWVRATGHEPSIEIRIGPAGYRLLAGMYRAIGVLAELGNNLIVDDVLFDRRVLRNAVDTLYLHKVLFVGIRCPLDVAEQREKERGDRFPGLARQHFEIVHAHGTYDLEVDTSTLTAIECASQIKQRLQHGSAPDAFRRLRNNWVSG